MSPLNPALLRIAALISLPGCLLFISDAEHDARKAAGLDSADDSAPPDDSTPPDDSAPPDDSTDDSAPPDDSADDSGPDPDSLAGTYTGTLSMDADGTLDNTCSGAIALVVDEDGAAEGTFTCTWESSVPYFSEVSGTVRGTVSEGDAWGVLTSTSDFSLTVSWEGVAAGGQSAAITATFAGDCEPTYTCDGDFTVRR